MGVEPTACRLGSRHSTTELQLMPSIRAIKWGAFCFLANSGEFAFEAGLMFSLKIRKQEAPQRIFGKEAKS